MTLEGKGRIICPSKGKLLIYIPAKVHNDSAFPFKKADDVHVRVDADGDRVVIAPYGGDTDAARSAVLSDSISGQERIGDEDDE